MLNTKGIQHSSQIMTQPKSILKQSKYTDNGLGYNPNDELESEYIDNLLKQIHFMNLEIKLLKEKSEENKGKMGISGLLQQDGKQLVDHVIISKDKYRQMKNDLNHQLVDNYDILQDLMHQFQVEENRKNYLENLTQNTRENIKSQDDDLQKKIKNFLDLGKKEKENKENLESQLIKLEKQVKDVKKDYDKAFEMEQYKDQNKKLDNQFEQEQIKLDKLIDDEEMKIINDYQQKIDTEKQQREKDLEFQKFLQEHQKLKLEKKQNDIQLMHLKYEVKEMEQLINYSSQEKATILDYKEKLKKDLDNLKDVYLEIEKTNQLKVQKKLNLIENQISRDLNKQLIQLQRELEQQKQKYINLEKDTKQLMKQTIEKKGNLQQLVNQNNKYVQGMLDNHEIINKIQPDQLNLKQVIEQDTMKYKDLNTINNKLLQQLHQLEEQDIDYQSSVDFLKKNIHMDEDLKQINLEDLKILQAKNVNINNTIDGFINKWADIKRFSQF